jgi:hypothetical protein
VKLRSEVVIDDLQHRQAFVGDQGGIDDRADTGLVRSVVIGEREAEQAVDLVLVEDALGPAANCRQVLLIILGTDHRLPFGRQVEVVSVLGHGFPFGRQCILVHIVRHACAFRWSSSA